ncbi:MAG: AraC family transcriptional regulator [Eubacteriales bacterium]|nr:AraC family transcriptional regulator [Eubacteriales bacterium]
MSNNVTHIFNDTNYTDLRLYQFGYEHCAPMLSCGPAVHNHYLLHYIISGSGTFATDDMTYSLKAGQAFLISPKQVTIYTASANSPWHYIWIEFDGLKAQSFLLDAGLSSKSPIYIPKSPEQGRILMEEMNCLMEHHQDSSIRLIGYLYLIFDILINSSLNKRTAISGSLHDFYVREAINYIESNYQNNISVSDIASWCNLDPSYFGKIFKDSVLINPQKYILQYRMMKASEYLMNTSLPVKEIATLVGYDNSLNFSRAFKNELGISPINWRKENQLKKLIN